MSLGSFDHGDSAWSVLNSSTTKNNGGAVGAWISDFLFSVFGIMAWVYVALFTGILIKLITGRGEPLRWKFSFLYLYTPAFIVTLLACCGLSSLYWNSFSASATSGGGITGSLVLEFLLPAFGIYGTALFLIAFFLSGFTLLTHFSWFLLIDYLTRFFVIIFHKVTDFLSHFCRLILQGIIKGIKKVSSIEFRRKADVSEQNSYRFVKRDEVVTPAKDKPKKSEITSTSVITVHPVDKASLSTLLLDRPDPKIAGEKSIEEQQVRAQLLEEKLKDYGVEAKVVAIQPGPVVTRYEIQPAPGLKVSKISGLATDLARSLAVVRVRVVEVIPGKSVVGIEVPNTERQMVVLSEVMESKEFVNAKSPLSLALGQLINGDAMVANLAKMPHLLVAGTTGSGKSVGVNAMILSLLYKASPAEVRLIMVDPKMLELSVYEGIPHLLTPVVTDMKEAAGALRWCVMEMERRYKLMASLGVRNISGYNAKVKQLKENGFTGENTTDTDESSELLPFIVVVIDEFADMMMIVGKKVEELIARIAQKARAAGIHLILATQRPSVDVITGLIKANVPARISFQVSSKVDSRTIIDQGGAEQLLGHGDMLYLPPGTGLPVRVHGAFVSDQEVHRVVADWKLRGKPEYIDDIVNCGASDSQAGNAFSDEASEEDELYDQAVAFVTEARRVSVSFVQRQFRIGYNRAANLVETMEREGVVSSAASNGAREVLVAPPPK